MSETPNIYDEGQTLLFDKPFGWTSFDVVKKIRRATKAKRVGHAGTLDPMASGLLILCTGKHTKTISEIQVQEKEYTGIMILGAITASYDRETIIQEKKSFEHITEEIIEKTIKDFRGEIEQIPPAHSARKVDGKRAYELARKGEQAILKPSVVNIKEFEITKINLPELEFRVVCSKGTYIRSLVHDLGQSLGTGAYLHTLRRTRIGSYNLEEANNVFEFVDKLRAENQQVK